MFIRLVAVFVKDTNEQRNIRIFISNKKSWQWSELLLWLFVEWFVYSHQSDFTSLQFHFLFDVFAEKKFEYFISISSSVMIKNSITLFEDQYKFFKTFNSPNLMIAFVEFMFEDIEPKNLTEQEQVIFNSLRIRMDNLKKKSVAWTKSHWWWRPKKSNENTEEETTKKQQKNNKKTTQQTTKKQEEQEQDQEQVKEQELIQKEDMCNKLHDDVSFEKFWNLYPNKKDKKKSKQKFDRLSLIKKQLAIDWILKLKNSEQWQKWFIPLPTTYLNWERREDEVNDNNSRIKQIQDYQQKARLEEAKKLLVNDENWNERNDENSTFDRRTEINSS